MSTQVSTPIHTMSHLDWLEAEAIYIMREVAAECARPAMLFSGGKDSIVMLRLAEKAFRPGKFPFPLVHIDTEHNFPEVIEFRGLEIWILQVVHFSFLFGKTRFIFGLSQMMLTQLLFVCIVIQPTIGWIHQMMT